MFWKDQKDKSFKMNFIIQNHFTNSFINQFDLKTKVVVISCEFFGFKKKKKSIHNLCFGVNWIATHASQNQSFNIIALYLLDSPRPYLQRMIVMQLSSLTLSVGHPNGRRAMET